MQVSGIFSLHTSSLWYSALCNLVSWCSWSVTHVSSSQEVFWASPGSLPWASFWKLSQGYQLGQSQRDSCSTSLLHSLMSNVFKTFVLYILFRFLSSLDETMNLIPVISSWAELEVTDSLKKIYCGHQIIL